MILGIENVLAAVSSQRAGLSRAATNRVATMVTNFDGWYSGQSAQDFALQLAALAENTADSSARLSDTASTLMIREMTGEWPNRGPRITDGTARYGVTAFEAYDRIPAHYRVAVSRGLTNAAALASTINRARRMMDLEVSLAAREQYRSTFAANKGVVDGFRRVIRPELSKTGTCGLCIAASDQVYTVETLMPIHPGCNCEVLPIVDGWDPGEYVNTEDLARLYETAAENARDETKGVPSRSQLSSVRVVVDQHNEYGPMLRNSEHNLQTLEDLVDQSRDAREVQYHAELADLEQRYRDALVLRASGEPLDADLVEMKDHLMRARTRTRAWSKFYGVQRATPRRGPTTLSVVDLV